VLDATLRRWPQLSTAERAALTRRVRGTLQWRLQLDALLNRLLPKGLRHTDERVAWVLRLGSFVALHEPSTGAYAAVDGAVRLCRQVRRAPLAGLVNAVLRRVASGPPVARIAAELHPNDPDARLGVEVSLPRWLAARFRARLGPGQARSLGLAFNSPAPFTVRPQHPLDRDTLRQRLEAEGIEAQPTRWAPDGLHLSRIGRLDALGLLRERALFVQDEAALLTAHLLAPPPGSRVLDCCAAPGGKAAHLLSLMGHVGQVVARDLKPGRVRLLRELSERVPLRVERHDVLASEGPDLEQPPFDAVLLDAPCSNLGTLRRHPEAKGRVRPEMIDRCAALQARMLPAAARRVRPGGVLVYAVCSLAPEEGWGVVHPFLASEAGQRFQVEAPPRPPAFASLLDEQGAFVSLPHRHDMDGFYAVRLRARPQESA